MAQNSTRAKNADEAEQLLATYLRDHHAGAAAGLTLLRRCQQSNDGTPLGAALAEIHGEVDQDRRSLEQIMDLLRVNPSRVKTAIGKVTPLIGRLKPNNRPFGPYSPLTRVLELETLVAGILSKHHLWLALLARADADTRLDRGELERLCARARAQRERVTHLHAGAAGDAFTPPANASQSRHP